MRALLTSLVLVFPMMVWGCSSDGDGSEGAAGTGGLAGAGGAGSEVPAKPVIGTLSPYPDNVPGQDGSDLFPPNSVEAHWYQWNNRYVVLYRGYDATDTTGICPGNSIENQGNFTNISNSPYPSSVVAACGTANLALPPAGSFSCGGLLYYVTEIATQFTSNLWGTIELSTSQGYIGQTTFGTPTDLANTPEFEPGLTTYDLPAAAIDSLDVVNCP